VKPSPFAYTRPTSVDDALRVLADAGDDGKVLAGGQSLIPVLSMRLAAPKHLIDVNRLHDLAYVRVEDGGVRVGALARHAQVERDDAAFAAVPLLRQGLRLVAHPTIRNRGTTVGSLAHGDPSGEMTAVLTLLGGTVELQKQGASRTVAADDFFVGPLESAVATGELATSAFFPAPPPRTGTAFVELARRHGDYAMCGLAAAVTVDEDHRVVSARAAYISVGPVPVLLDLTDALVGAHRDAADWAAAGRFAAGAVDPEPDIHASADYRRHLVEVLTTRALAEAASGQEEAA
jgi:carbon-monoxide dehydrogenase medium subunit